MRTIACIAILMAILFGGSLAQAGFDPGVPDISCDIYGANFIGDNFFSVTGETLSICYPGDSTEEVFGAFSMNWLVNDKSFSLVDYDNNDLLFGTLSSLEIDPPAVGGLDTTYYLLGDVKGGSFSSDFGSSVGIILTLYGNDIREGAPFGVADVTSTVPVPASGLLLLIGISLVLGKRSLTRKTD